MAGDGVTLEPQVAAHAEALFACIGDPALYAYIDAPPPTSVAALAARLLRLEARRSPDGTALWLNWIVRDAVGTVVGYVQATVDADGTAEIAYVLGRAHWRQGIATAACRAMIAELRAQYGVRRLRATVDPRNAASLALLRRLGFAPVAESDGEMVLDRELG